MTTTINGTGGNDWIVGTAADEQIYGLAGNDTLQGGTGNDLIVGGAGNDLLYDGNGNDTFVGGAGNDMIDAWSSTPATVVYAGNLADYNIAFDFTINALVITDSVRGRDGVDEVFLPPGGSFLQFADGTVSTLPYYPPVVHGTIGNDTLIGSAASDEIWGGGGNDSISGGLGNDELDGGAGNDTIDGGGGNDYLLGNGGNDILTGGTGDDTLMIGPGNSTVNGGVGNDRVEFLGSQNRIASLAVHGPQDTGAGIVTLISIENIVGGYGSNILTGDDQANQVWGNNAADTLYGGGGADSLYGGKGNDVLDGGQGNDLLTGGPGSDTFLFSTRAGPRNVDVVADFNTTQDVIGLNHAIYSRLALGSLPVIAFQSGVSSVAASPNVRIIFDSTTGALFYDPDGNGAEPAVHFATLSLVGLAGGPVTAADFVIV